MKQYETNITAGFSMQWSISKSIMEYISNMLDQGDYSFDFGEDYLELTNHSVKVSPKSLMLGLSDKTNDPTTRGKFGSGSVQAMPALLSQGVTITITNNDLTWTPVFQYSSVWDEEVLVILEQYNGGIGKDYVVLLEGLEEEDLKEIKQRCLEFQAREVLYSTELGDLIESGEGEEGELYVGDIFVTQNTDFKYSYNFKPHVVTLTQDRNALDSWQLRRLTAQLISQIDDEDFIKEAIEANTYDTELVNDHFYTKKSCSEDAHAAVGLFGKEFVLENEGKIVTDDYTEHKENEKLGNASVYIENSAKVQAIQQSDVYKSSIACVDIVAKQSIDEYIEELEESIMRIVDNNMNAEDGAKVKQLLDCLSEEAHQWSGDVEDGSLPF